MTNDLALALPVVAPLAAAGLLLATGHLLPRRTPDVLAILLAAATSLLCAELARRAAHGPVVTWFGGWAPVHGQVLGIGFAATETGAAIAAFVSALTAAATLFAWGFFDEVGVHFHVVLLCFLAGMTGFCLTHDLFDLFVWFEVMSVAAYALTAYTLKRSALAGALNFTVANTIGSYALLAGIGLLYARAGALDFAALQLALARGPDDIVVRAGFVLIATGLLTKGAQAPFHLWLSDAHAVAPSPVSVLFSGAMVPLGLFGLATLLHTVFAGVASVQHVAHAFLLWLGAASALIGGVMALLQRHLKRLLAFSTVSHAGLMLIGVALGGTGLAGFAAYLIGHGLIKGALFMIAGILLATRASIDELELRGLGRGLGPTGLAMAAAGLLLAGAPLGLLATGDSLLHHQAAPRPLLAAILVAAGACTGGAVLRAAGRIFWGLGPTPSDETQAPSEAEQEKADRPLWLMLTPVLVLLAAALAIPHGPAARLALHAAAAFTHPDAPALLGLAAPHPPPLPEPTPSDNPLPGLLAAGLAFALAAAALNWHRLPPGPRRLAALAAAVPGKILRKLHDARVGDIVAWMIAGVALVACRFVLF